MENSAEILKQLQGLREQVTDFKYQQKHFEAFFESELGNFTRQLNDLNRREEERDKRVQDLQLWKSNLNGKIFIIGFIIGALVGWVIKKYG